MASWEDAKHRSDEQKAQGGIYLRLADDKDKFVGAIVGDVQFHDFVWNEKQEKYDPWSAEAEKAGKKKVTRYSMNVYVLKIGNGKEMKDVPSTEAVKVWECNNQTFQDVLKVREKYGFDKWFFEVERNGKKGNSKTTYSILPETKIGDDDTKTIAGLKLHDLTKVRDEGDDESTDMSSHDKKTNGAAAASSAASTPAAPETIDAETSSKIIGRLKALPKDKIDAFLAKFEVKQVKTLKKSDLPAAEAWLAANEKPAEVDPFA